MPLINQSNPDTQRQINLKQQMSDAFNPAPSNQPSIWEQLIGMFSQPSQDVPNLPAQPITNIQKPVDQKSPLSTAFKGALLNSKGNQ